MLQHNRLYLKNKSKIPEMYTFVLTYCLNNHFAPGIRKPLTRLLKSANQRRILNHEEIVSDPQYAQEFYNCPPNSFHIIGMNYNLLRYFTDMSLTCILLDNEPFGDHRSKISHSLQYITTISLYHI